MTLMISLVKCFLALLLLHLIHYEPYKFSDAAEQTGIAERKNEYLIDKNMIKFSSQSYSGFLTGKDSSHLFFWLFKSMSQKETDPLIVWLQGDIGTSSLKGLYENNGPFYVKQSKGSHPRRSYWAQNYNVLYLDTAVETGYSHFNKTNHSLKNMDELISNLYTALNTFFQKFNSYTNKDLYLAGDGFACKVLTQLAMTIHNKRNIMLKGLIIENGFCDPPNSIPIANHLHSLLLLDSFGRTKMAQAERQILDLIRNNKHEEAFDKYDVYIKGLNTPYKTHFLNLTRYESSQNLLHDKEYRIRGNFSNFVMKESLRRALHVPTELAYINGKNLLMKVRGDLMKGSSTELGKLMDLNYRVLMYYGQMNPEITPKGAFLTASTIKWCGSAFLGDAYSPWFVNDHLAGYIANVVTGDCKGSLTWALLRNAGKDIADEKQQEVLDLIDKFITKTF